jgi:putative hemolysin
MKSSALLIATGILGCLALSSCSSTEPQKNAAAISNPASEYCVKEKGGRIEIVTDQSGAQKGICHLPDGTAVDEWELFRKDHPQNQ